MVLPISCALKCHLRAKRQSVNAVRILSTGGSGQGYRLRYLTSTRCAFDCDLCIGRRNAPVDRRRYARCSLPKGLLYARNFGVGESPPFCLDSLRNNRLQDSAKLGTLRKRVTHVADNREGQKNGGLFHHGRLPIRSGRGPSQYSAASDFVTSSVEEPGAKSRE